MKIQLIFQSFNQILFVFICLFFIFIINKRKKLTDFYRNTWLLKVMMNCFVMGKHFRLEIGRKKKTRRTHIRLSVTCRQLIELIYRSILDKLAVVVVNLFPHFLCFYTFILLSNHFLKIRMKG